MIVNFKFLAFGWFLVWWFLLFFVSNGLVLMVSFVVGLQNKDGSKMEKRLKKSFKKSREKRNNNSGGFSFQTVASPKDSQQKKFNVALSLSYRKNFLRLTGVLTAVPCPHDSKKSVSV